MAQCDEGYGCDRCGEYVENVQESELYLRYVLGAVPLDELPREPERHLRCSPELAQFIVDEGFPPVRCDDPALDKRSLPPEVRARQERVFTLGALSFAVAAAVVLLLGVETRGKALEEVSQ